MTLVMMAIITIIIIIIQAGGGRCAAAGVRGVEFDAGGGTVRDDADVAGSSPPHGRLRGRGGHRGVANGQHAAARAARHVPLSRRLREPPQDAVDHVQPHVRAQRFRGVRIRHDNRASISINA